MTTFTPAFSPTIGYAPAATLQAAQAMTNLSEVPGGQLSVALLGDSFMAKNNSAVTVATAVWDNGVVTIVTSLAHGLRQGNPIRYVGVTGSASTALNGVTTVRSIISTTSFTFATPPGVSISAGSTATADLVMDLERLSTLGIITWANMFSGQRMNVVYNGGKGGDTTANMLLRLQSEIIPLKPQVCIILGGVNDTAVATNTAAVISGNLISMASLCVQYGIIPILLTIFPVASGLASASTRQAVINQTNNLLKNYAGKNTNVLLIDTATSVMNPATGYMLASCVSSDGGNIHLGKLGARVAGQMIADVIGRNRYGYLLTAGALDNFNASTTNYNIIDNAPWVATGGVVGAGCSGTAAQGFNVLRTAGSGTAVASAPARTMVDDGDTIGFNQRLAITSGGATDVFDIRVNQGTDTSTFTRFVTGGTYELRMAMRVQNLQGSGLANITPSFSLNMTDSVTGFAYTTLLNAWVNTEIAALDQAYPVGYCVTADHTIVVRSLPFTIPTAVTSSNGAGVRIILQFSAALTAGNPPLIVDVGRVSIVRTA